MSEFGLLLARFASVLSLLSTVSFFVFSVWLSAVDIATRRLPNRLVSTSLWVTMGLAVAACLLPLTTSGRESALRDVTWLLGGAAVLALLLLTLWLAVPGGIGAGDVKIAPLVGGMTGYLGGGWGLLVGIAVAFTCAAVWGLVLRSRGGGSDVPFAPCLFAGAWIGVIVTVLVLW